MFGRVGGREVEGARLSQQIFPAFSGHRRVEQERRAVGSNARNMILSKNKKIVVFETHHHHYLTKYTLYLTTLRPMSGVMSRMISVLVKFLATLVTRLGPMMANVPGSL